MFFGDDSRMQGTFRHVTVVHVGLQLHPSLLVVVPVISSPLLPPLRSRNVVSGPVYLQWRVAWVVVPPPLPRLPLHLLLLRHLVLDAVGPVLRFADDVALVCQRELAGDQVVVEVVVCDWWNGHFV